MSDSSCSICNGTSDSELTKREFWRNERWRLSLSKYRDVFGLCYLEPLRHIRYITELDGKEATEFGPLLANITAALRASTGSKLIYVYIFGDSVPHLHVHLAPHHDGDLFTEGIVKTGVGFSDEVMNEEVITSFIRQVRNFIVASS